jgi:glycine dehydrogenase
MDKITNADLLPAVDRYVNRHIGPSEADVARMLAELGLEDLDQLIDKAVPDVIRMQGRLDLPEPCSESHALSEMRKLSERNQVYRSYIGMGYANSLTPTVIQRNVFENPGWYTQYTPYQAEIAQGRLEALLNFQTMIGDLTGLEIANASMLDEGTAAAEAMTMCQRFLPRKSTANTFFVSELCHPHVIDVVQTRADSLGIEVIVGDHMNYAFEQETFGVLVQYPATGGAVLDYEHFFEKAHEAGAMTIVAADLLALTLLRPPGEFGADVVVGNSQRFGVPLGYGGPHAAFMATQEKYKRQLPGRLVGVSVDTTGAPALRLALQTREQHIRRERATSNICTAQVLLAVMASMYAVYHGPEGLRQIARRVRLLTSVLGRGLESLGYMLNHGLTFDTLTIVDGPRDQEKLIAAAVEQGINLRRYDSGALGISLDEATTAEDLADLLGVFGADEDAIDLARYAAENNLASPRTYAHKPQSLITISGGSG